MSRTWFITGVSSGLGRALARATLGRGERVWGTVRKPADRDAFLGLGPAEATGVSLADMTDHDAIAAAVSEAEARFGGIDVLVNNAGYGVMGAVEETSVAEAQAQFAVNVWGPLACIQAVLPGMRARGSGHIVNVTSVSGLATWGGQGLYCASKFALEAIGMTLAEEVEPLGLHVTNVAPGGLRTNFGGDALTLAKARIDAYAGTAHANARHFVDHFGHEPNNTDKAALAILAAVDASEPPRHLLLGADALRYATRYMAELQTDIGEWAALSTSVAVDAAKPTGAP